jgi:hypothetical protein
VTSEDTRPTINVDAHTVAIGMLCGLLRPCNDGEWELTEKGEAWFHEWLIKRVAQLDVKAP